MDEEQLEQIVVNFIVTALLITIVVIAGLAIIETEHLGLFDQLKNIILYSTVIIIWMEWHGRILNHGETIWKITN